MPAGEFTPATEVAQKWKQYAAGGPYNLVADSPGGKSCCRMVVMLADGNLTACVMRDGSTDAPLTGLKSGYQHLAACSSITPSVAVIVYW